MKKYLILSMLLMAAIFSAGAQQTELLVSAAASLTDVLNSLKVDAEKATGAKILFNFGGSGALRQQIESGAPADLFFSAASEDVDRLEKAGLVDKASRVNVLSNAIVLVGSDKQPKPVTNEDLKALLGSAQLLAIGNPDSVPAGRYAVQALKSLGLYETVEKKLVLGGNVRQVLQYVESGSAPLGIVFATDALSVKAGSPVVRLYDFPQSAIATPVLYPVVVVSASAHKAEAAKFIAFLQTKEATDAFIRAGFVVVGK